MAILSNFWAEHLKNIAGSADANKNMKAYTDALPSSKTQSEMIDALVEKVYLLIDLLPFGQKEYPNTKPQL